MLFRSFYLDLFILLNSFGNRWTRIEEQIEIGRIVDLCRVKISSRKFIEKISIQISSMEN